MNVERLVIDSSVALKWRLRDEGELAQADALQSDFAAGRVELLAPTLFDYEIGNVLKVAVSRKRLTELEAVIALADFKAIKLNATDFCRFKIELLIWPSVTSDQFTTLHIWLWLKLTASNSIPETNVCTTLSTAFSPG